MKIIWKQSYTGMPFNSFEDKIKDKLHDATMQPNTVVWDKISSRLEVEGANENKSAFILPLFLRKENLKYSLSAAAAVTLMAVALNNWSPAIENNTEGNFLAEVNTVEVEETPCIEVQEQAGELEVYTPAKPSNHKPIKRIEEETRFQLLAGHEISVEPVSPAGLRVATHDNKRKLETLSPLSTSIAGIDAQPVVALASNTNLEYRVVPMAKRKTRTFKPKMTWGVTAMSALQLNSLSESFASSASEDNLVGISSLSSQFQYPNGLTSARAEVELLLSEKLGISSGVGFTHSFQSSNMDAIDRDATSLGATPISTTGNPPNIDFASLNGSSSSINELNYSSIDIPLFLNYYLKKGRSNILLSTGLLYKHMMEGEPNLLVETVSYTTNAQPSVRYVDPMEGNFSIQDLVFLIGRAHYQLKLGRSIALHAGPTLNMGLGPAFSYQQSSSRNPLSMGFEVGLKFFPGG